jgi:hypothetical protein
VRAKKQLDLVRAVTAFQSWGIGVAARNGFSRREFRILWWLALYPKYVTEAISDGHRTLLLEAIGRDPDKAFEVITAIRKLNNRRRDSPIRNLLCDYDADPPNWTLPDAVIADKVAKHLGRTFSGKRLLNLIEAVKKIRQELTKRYPAKGKL